MGIYEDETDEMAKIVKQARPQREFPGINFSELRLGKETAKFVLIATIVLAIIFLFFWLYLSSKNNSIGYDFLTTNKARTGSVKPGTELLLQLDISNPTDSDADKVDVLVSPVDKTALLFSQTKQTIPVLEKGLNKQLFFNLKIAESVNPGKYGIDVQTTINGKLFSRRIVLTIRDK
jgi:hypothetical protein